MPSTFLLIPWGAPLCFSLYLDFTKKRVLKVHICAAAPRGAEAAGKMAECLGTMNKRILFLFLAVLLLGLALRVKGLLTGLPSETGRLSTYHFDEYITFGALGNMDPARLDFFPGEALYWGTFQVYLQGAVLKGMQAAGLFVPGDKDYLKKNLKMADRMYVSGRLVTIIFSCLSVVLLFRISTVLLAGYFALLPPLFLALAYVDIYMASLVKPDSIMMFFGLCSFYFALQVLRGESGVKAQLLAGAFGGLSFVTKYTGLVFGFHYLASAAYRAFREKAPGRWTVNLAVYLLAFAALFVLVNPYFIIRNAETLVYMKAVFAKAGGAADALKAYAEYFAQVLPVSFGWPAAALGLVSTAYALFWGSSRELRLAAAFSAVYLLKFGAAPSPVFTYSLPLAPFFALTAGYFIEKKMSGGIFGRALAAAALLYTAAYPVYQKSLWSETNTITAASAWLEGAADKRSTVCVSKVDVWTPRALRRYEPELRLMAAADSSAAIPEGLAALERKLDKCDYVVLSEYETRAPGGAAALAAIEERLSAGFSEAAVFLRQRSRLFVASESPHYLGANFVNPDIRIFKRKD